MPAGWLAKRLSGWHNARGSDYGDHSRFNDIRQHRHPVCVFGPHRSDNFKQLPVLNHDHDRSRWRCELTISSGAAGRDINGACWLGMPLYSFVSSGARVNQVGVENSANRDSLVSSLSTMLGQFNALPNTTVTVYNLAAIDSQRSPLNATLGSLKDILGKLRAAASTIPDSSAASVPIKGLVYDAGRPCKESERWLTHARCFQERLADAERYRHQIFVWAVKPHAGTAAKGETVSALRKCGV